MSVPAPQTRTGTLLLAEFTDLRRALVTDQALNPDEVRRLAEEAVQLGGHPVELSARRMLLYFGDAAAALASAQNLQRFFAGIRATHPERHSLTARAMLGYGRLVIDGDRVRGDWPHRLAGLMSRVPAHCITALQPYVDALPRDSLPAAPRVLVDDLLLLQVADATAVETRLASPLTADPGVFTTITLRIRGVPHVFRSADCPVLIGRDARCAVRIASETASRIHGRIEHTRGKFYYVDDSRNSSWVLTGAGEEVQLSKDRILLIGEGAISPGAPLSQQTGEVLRFSCQSTRLAMSDETPGDTRPLNPKRS